MNDVLAVQNDFARQLVCVFPDFIVLDHYDHEIHRGEELVPIDEVVTPDNTLHTGVGATPAADAVPAPETDAGEKPAADTEAAASETEPPPAD